ncbi:MAG: hypothetical protein WHT28_14235, partial [Fimbriimonadales bacterium]
MRLKNAVPRVFWTASVIGVSSVVLAQPQGQFRGLGFLPGDTASAATAVSDRMTVVGHGNRLGFLWRPNTGLQALDFPGATATIAHDVSANDVVVGQAVFGSQMRACSWDEEGAHILVNRQSAAMGISIDGQTIVGWAEHPISYRVVPFVWTAENLVWLPEPQGSMGTNYAYGVSGDGQVVGGIAMMLSPDRIMGLPVISARGFVWIDGVPYERFLPSGGFGSQVNALSYDGYIAVGSAQRMPGQPQRQAVLWEGESATLLGTVGGRTSIAWSVDGAGQQVVGSSDTTEGMGRAFYWTRAVGMVPLQQLFQTLIPEGWQLISAKDISPNGRYIVGVGINPDGATEAWLLDTGRNCYSNGDVDASGCVDEVDLMAVLFAFGNWGDPADVNCDGLVDDNDLLEVLFG